MRSLSYRPANVLELQLVMSKGSRHSMSVIHVWSYMQSLESSTVNGNSELITGISHDSGRKLPHLTIFFIYLYVWNYINPCIMP